MEHTTLHPSNAKPAESDKRSTQNAKGQSLPSQPAAQRAQHPRIVVEKDGMEVSLDLDSFDTNV